MPRRQETPPDILAAAKRLAPARERAKALGLPLKPDDMRPRPPVPESKNAAPLYEEMMPLYREAVRRDGGPSPDWLNYLEPGRTEEHRQAAKAAIARSGELMMRGRQATERPRCVFDRPWEQGSDFKTPEFGVMRYLGHLFCCKALLELEEARNPFKAIDAVVQAGKICRHFEEPGLMTLLLRLDLLASTVNPFVVLINSDLSDNNNVLEAVEKSAPHFANLVTIPAFLTGELFATVWDIEQYRAGDLSVDRLAGRGASRRVPDDLPPGQRKLYADAWEARVLDFYNDLFTLYRKPNQTLYQQEVFIKKRVAEQEKRFKLGDISYLLVNAKTDFLPNLYVESMEVIAYIRIRAVLVAANKKFNDTRNLPAYLPLPLNDPFDDKPLRYRYDSEGITVYSIGANRKDDGGDSTTDGPDNRHRDIAAGFVLVPR